MSDYHEEPIETPEPLREEEWLVKRHGDVKEVSLGDNLRYRTRIWDEGRDPFVTKWFNDPKPAMDLLDNIKNENERHHDARLGGNEDGS
jgi:hypothetical protein